MEIGCQHLDRKGRYCHHAVWGDRDFCRWHTAINDITCCIPRSWGAMLGVLLGMIGVNTALGFFSEARTLLVTGRGSPTGLYGELAATGYFGSLCMILYVRSTRVLWPKILVVSLAMNAFSLIGYNLSREKGTTLYVGDVALGLLLIVQGLVFTLSIPPRNNVGAGIIGGALYVAALLYSDSVWASAMILAFLFAYLVRVHYGTRSGHS